VASVMRLGACLPRGGPLNCGACPLRLSENSSKGNGDSVAVGPDLGFVVEGSGAGIADEAEAYFKHVGHVYYRKWWGRAGTVLLLIVGAAFCTTVWDVPNFSPQNPQLLTMFVSAVILFVGIYQTANAFISTVTLFAESVESRTAFVCRRLLFSEIRGRRQYITGGRYKTAYFSLVPNDDRLYTLAFVQAFNFDEAFFRWFNHLPDLDAADEKMEKESKAGLG